MAEASSSTPSDFKKSADLETPWQSLDDCERSIMALSPRLKALLKVEQPQTVQCSAEPLTEEEKEQLKQANEIWRGKRALRDGLEKYLFYYLDTAVTLNGVPLEKATALIEEYMNGVWGKEQAPGASSKIIKDKLDSFLAAKENKNQDEKFQTLHVHAQDLEKLIGKNKLDRQKILSGHKALLKEFTVLTGHASPSLKNISSLNEDGLNTMRTLIKNCMALNNQTISKGSEDEAGRAREEFDLRRKLGYANYIEQTIHELKSFLGSVEYASIWMDVIARTENFFKSGVQDAAFEGIVRWNEKTPYKPGWKPKQHGIERPIVSKDDALVIPPEKSKRIQLLVENFKNAWDLVHGRYDEHHAGTPSVIAHLQVITKKIVKDLEKVK